MSASLYPVHEANLYKRLDDVEDTAANTKADLQTHEAVCAQRHGAIQDSLERQNKKLNFLIGLIGVVATAAMFGGPQGVQAAIKLLGVMH